MIIMALTSSENVCATQSTPVLNNDACAAKSSRPSIAEFYNGRSVFVTGATGFMGKVLVEKLLRSCPGIESIYLLIRPNSKGSPAERMQIMLNSALFGVLREINPGAFQKLVPIPGDMLDEGLGVSKESIMLMADKVSVVFHTAATVKFDEALRLSLELNVVGTKRLVALCRNLSKLEALVHVSTAYANCDRPVIAEKIYLPPAEPEMILSALTGENCNFSTSTLERLTARIVHGHADDAHNRKSHIPLGSRPNTYTYTKALAEYVLYTNAKDMPVVIARPSIVGAAWKEPLPGWIDNYNGPTGLLLAIGSGALRHMLGDCSAIADIIPVDIACNMLICIAYETAIDKNRCSDEIKVYHCSSGASGNATTWGNLERLSYKTWMENPTERLYRVPSVHFWSNWYVKESMVCLDHWIPAYLFDCYQRLTGQRPRMVPLYEKLHKAVKTLEYFTLNQWIFMQDNISRIRDSMSADDAQDFDIDVRKLQWDAYVRNYCLGIKRFVLKEDLAKLPEARQKLQKRVGLVKQLAWGIVSMLLTAALTKLGLLRLLGLASSSGGNGSSRLPTGGRSSSPSGNLRHADVRDAVSTAGGGGVATSSSGTSQSGSLTVVAYITLRKVLLVVIRFCIHLIKILLSSSSMS